MNKESNWLPLNEYSSRYRVSVSTLRRRIKGNDINFNFIDGKYLIFDEPLSTQRQYHRPSQSDDVLNTQTENDQAQVKALPALDLGRQETKDVTSNELVFTAANKLLGELKKAYMQILQEKEEQILLLKDEITDLKTLVRVLEEDNRRLTNIS